MSLSAARAKFESPDAVPIKPKTASASKDKAEKKDDLDKEVERLLKEGLWKEKTDPKGKKYYYNTQTRKTCWDLKKELKKDRAATPPPATSPASSPRGEAKAAEPEVQQPKPAVAAPTQPALASPASPIAPESIVSPVTPRAAEVVSPQVPATGTATGAPIPKAATAAEPSAVANVTHTASADPVVRLLEENKALQQLVAGGSRGQVALDVQAKLDALTRANTAMSVQTDRMHIEHDAMQRALNNANLRIHELELELTACRRNEVTRTKDEELMATVGHLREQNRVLVTQIAELSTLLARGLNEGAFAGASQLPGNTPIPTMPIPQRMDQLSQQSNVGRIGGPAPNAPSTSPAYASVPNMTQPPSQYHYSETAGQSASPRGPQAALGTPGYSLPPQSPNASQQHPTSNGIMFGGFLVRNPRMP